MNALFTFSRRHGASAAHTPQRYVCPRCKGSVVRTRRRLIDRLISVIVPVYRYRCVALGCQWRGNMRQRRR